jgi:hypothetical protein
VQLALSAGGRIAGRVTLDGQLFDPGGKYVAVMATPAGLDAWAAGATSVRLGRDGRFDVRGVAGRLVIRVVDKATELALARATLFDRDVTGSGVLVSPREQVVDVNVALTSMPTEVSGRVVVQPSKDAQVAPCAVVVFSTDASRWSWPASRYVASTAPRAGVFSIVGLPPGSYWGVAVSDVDVEHTSVEYLTQVRRLATKVALRAGETASVTLRLQQ